jgi:release factor glutamine methyltransferase
MLINIIRSYWKEFGERPPVIADLCSGSGNIAITLKGLFPDGAIYAVENSPLAIPTFKTNCEINNADVNLITGSVLEAATTEKFRFSGGETRRADIIVCNPPYLTKIEMNTLQPELKHEPEAALYGGLDGLDFYRTIPVLWKEAIIPGGLLIFEIGADQARDVRRILTKAGFERITVQKDLSGNDRVVTAFVPA